MHLLGCLFILILVIVLIPLIFLGSIISMLFGRRPGASFKWTNMNGAGQQGQQSTNNQHQQSQPQQETPQKKIFNKDDGEYVDYEEVK